MAVEDFEKLNAYIIQMLEEFPNQADYQESLIKAVFNKDDMFKNFEVVPLNRTIAGDLVNKDALHLLGFNYKDKQLITLGESDSIRLGISQPPNNNLDFLYFYDLKNNESFDMSFAEDILKLLIVINHMI